MATKKASPIKTVKVTHPAHPEHSKFQAILDALAKAAAIAPAIVEMSGVDAGDAAKARKYANLTTAIIGSLTK